MKRVGVLILGLLLIGSVHAQLPSGAQRSEQAEEIQFLFYEAINLVADDSTKSRVDIPYRIDKQFFIVIKNSDPVSPHPFTRRGEVLIELLDKDGVSKAREINRFEIGETKPESAVDEKTWYQNMASFSVPPGEYTIVIEVDDLESKRKFLDRKRTVTAKTFDRTAVENSDMFVHRPNGNLITHENFGGNIEFGSEAFLFVQLYSKSLTSDPVHVEYSVSTQPFLFKDAQQIFADTIVRHDLLETDWPLVDKAENGVPKYTLSNDEKNPYTSAVLIPLRAERLQLRPFTLDMKITQGELTFTVKKAFRMVWPGMPMSLRDIDFALDVLRYITREEELDSLKSGSRDTRLKHLEEFWKLKDRTPDTEYNEVMVEYYRRVDHTMRTFISIRGGDGYKTDRGRIYILYGPPTKTDRSLDPTSGFREVWMYERQGKRFVFLDESKSGNYTLVATQNL